MKFGNQTHGSDGSRVRSQAVQSCRGARERSRPDRRGPLGRARLAREVLIGRDRAPPAVPDAVGLIAEFPAQQSMTAAGRGVIQQDRELLAKCNLFRRLTAQERAALIAHVHIRKCAADETIFLMGGPGDSMMAVLSGHVRISVASPHGKERVLASLAAGETFGEIALLDGKARTANVRAASECRVAILDRCDVLSFLERHPNAWVGLAEALCERLRQADQQITEMVLRGLPVRLAKALLRMTAIEPPAPNGERLSQVRLSQSEIGSLVGATRESVNRWLGAWQRSGIVRIAGGLITIADRCALEELAELEPDANRDLSHWPLSHRSQRLQRARSLAQIPSP